MFKSNSQITNSSQITINKFGLGPTMFKTISSNSLNFLQEPKEDNDSILSADFPQAEPLKLEKPQPVYQLD